MLERLADLIDVVIVRPLQALADHPRVAAIGRRVEPRLAFLRDPPSPPASPGLRLTICALLLVGASWAFVGIAEDVARGGPLTAVDSHAAMWLHVRAIQGMVWAMDAVSEVGDPDLLLVVAGVAAIYLAWTRSWYRLVTLALAILGGTALEELLKAAFHRPRPRFPDPIDIFQGFSFPSGHALAAALFFGVLAAFAAESLAGRRRAAAVAGAVVAVLLVGFSRVYLGAHYLSDVLGGIAAGTAWLSLCVIAVDTLRRYRDRGRGRSPAVPNEGNHAADTGRDRAA